MDQFKVKYPDRRQLALMLENECGVQKCVCTTIKPNVLVYPDLKDFTSYSQFVANHITYIKLENPTSVPKTLVSPAMVLKMQTAHCFELSVLLVSFLIGCGYNAFVVQGYASEDVCNNDLRKIKLDLPKNYHEPKSLWDSFQVLDDTYAVEPEIDLCNKFVTFLMEEEEEKKKTYKDEVKKNSNHSFFDPLYGKRVHCWVMIIPLETKDDPFFIEPCSGERKEVSNENYVGIEAIWNHKNYWVNLQPLNGGCTQYDFTLTDTNCWEYLLSDKYQNEEDTSDLDLTENEPVKYVLMPNSWVDVLKVPRKQYVSLYPSGKKVVSYQNALKELYSDHLLPDGLVERTTYYAEPEYTDKAFVKETFRHSREHLICAEKSYTANDGIKTIKHYSKDSRADLIKRYTFWEDGNNMKTKQEIKFYNSKPNGLVNLEIDKNSVAATYCNRLDFLFWRKCEYSNEDNYLFNAKESISEDPKLMVIIESFLRDESKHKDKDIATRKFHLLSDLIEVDFQYGESQITCSTRKFRKPRSYEKEEDIDPVSMMIEYIVYPYDGHLNPLELGAMWRQLIKDEARVIYEVFEFEKELLKIIKSL